MGEQQRQLQRTAIGHGYEPIGQLRGLASEDLYIGLPIGGAWAGRSGAIGHSLGTCCGALDTGPGMGSGSGVGVGMAIDCRVLPPRMGNGMAIDAGVLLAPEWEPGWQPAADSEPMAAVPPHYSDVWSDADRDEAYDVWPDNDTRTPNKTPDGRRIKTQRGGANERSHNGHYKPKPHN